MERMDSSNCLNRDNTIGYNMKRDDLSSASSMGERLHQLCQLYTSICVVLSLSLLIDEENRSLNCIISVISIEYEIEMHSLYYANHR